MIGQRQPAARGRLGEAVARQVGDQQREMRRQQRRQGPERMGRGRGAVQQQEVRPLPHLLDVPGDPSGREESAVGPVRPVATVALPVEPTAHAPWPTGDVAARTAPAMPRALASGSGR